MTVTKGATLGELVSKYPAAVEVMLGYGLHCVGCHVAAFETIEQGAKAHGMSDADIEKMMKEINEAIKEKQ